MSDEVVTSSPISLIVTVEIFPERIEEFLDVMERDSAGSRDTEEGCLRFDVLRDQTNLNRFVFYEVYKNAEAIEIHRAAPHYKLWTDFKASGGVSSQTVIKTDSLFYKY